MVQRIKKTKYLGKNIKYRNVPDLAKKIGGTRDDARKLIEGKLKTTIRDKDGNIKEIDFSQSPLLLRQLNFKRLTKQLKEDLLKENVTIKGLQVKRANQLTEGEKIKSGFISGTYTVQIDMIIKISEKVVSRSKVIVVYGTLEQIKDAIINYANEYIEPMPDAEILRIDVKVLNINENVTFSIDQEDMFKTNPLSLQYHYTNIELNQGVDCVRRYLKSKYKKISPQTIDNFFKRDGVNINELKQFCINYNILMKAFDINGKVINEYIPEKINKSYGALQFLKYDSHLYPIKNGNLEKKKHDELKIKIIDDSRQLLNDFILNKKILPAEINYTGCDIISFIVDDTKYIMNDEYNKCLEYLKKYDLAHKIYDNIKIKHLFDIIEKSYDIENTYTFWPYHQLYDVSVTLFKTDNEYDINKVTTIDNNKHYTHCLKSLPYLIHFDYRTNKIIKHTTNPKIINDTSFYMIKPEYMSILLDKSGPYTGYYLKYCIKQGLRFNIYEEMTTEISKNHFKKVIDDLYTKIDNTQDLKDIINIGIGKMKQITDKVNKVKVKGIYDNVEINSISGFKERLNNDYTLVYDVNEKIGNIYTRRPINIQVLLQSKIIIYEKLMKLDIPKDNIIQIKTDSISYIGTLPNDLSEEIGGWKKEKFSSIKYVNDIIYEKKSFIIDPLEFSQNIQYTGYAGCGKTYKIINEIIPTLKDYIILTPSHKSLEEYRNEKINCQVIQLYTLQNIMPKENIVIIDEIGMIDKQGHDFIYKCSLLGKKIYVFGDYRQLLPFNILNEMNSEHYINFLFKHKYTINDNYRNHFTIEYYNKLINNEIDIIEEVNKYNAKSFDEADYIICYRIETANKYNKLMMDKLNLNKYSIGLKIICNCNKLYEKGIFNGFIYTIKNVSNKDITLSNDVTITIKEYDKCFNPAYAINLHKMQGQSIKSFYYPLDEDKFFLNGRSAYTLISRLKTK